jgi:hypothetical protein
MLHVYVWHFLYSTTDGNMPMNLGKKRKRTWSTRQRASRRMSSLVMIKHVKAEQSVPLFSVCVCWIDTACRWGLHDTSFPVRSRIGVLFSGSIDLGLRLLGGGASASTSPATLASSTLTSNSFWHDDSICLYWTFILSFLTLKACLLRLR